MKNRTMRWLMMVAAGAAMAWGGFEGGAGSCIARAAEPADTEGWVNLFDGKSLTGWTAVGTARYEVKDGMIVGTTNSGPNSFLTSNKHYGDFILELEFKVDQGTNSGIQIRSHRNDKGRVNGYQVEIDTSDRAWTGGIYDEGRRGWLYPLKDKPEAQKAFKRGEWNTFRIQCVKDSIKTWVNGVPASDLVDAMTSKGFIALQCHSDKQTHQIQWKNIRIKELGEHVWKPIFDGKSLTGWHAVGGGTWEAKDGILQGTSAATEKKHGHLFYDKEVTDFTARVKYKANKGNSGLYFRVQKTPDDVGVKGFQAEIDAANDAGGLYETNARAWVVQPKPEDVKKYFKPGQWNEMTVSAHGGRIVVHVNGVKTAELLNDVKGNPKGFLAVQLHGGQEMDIQFQSIELLEKK